MSFNEVKLFLLNLPPIFLDNIAIVIDLFGIFINLWVLWFIYKTYKSERNENHIDRHASNFIFYLWELIKAQEQLGKSINDINEELMRHSIWDQETRHSISSKAELYNYVLNFHTTLLPNPTSRYLHLLILAWEELEKIEEKSTDTTWSHKQLLKTYMPQIMKNVLESDRR